MKKLYTLLGLIAISCGPIAYGQTQIENGGFETWENEGSDEEEPTQWSSIKTSDDDSWLNLAGQAPQVVWKETTNPYSGSACMRLKVADYNILVSLAPNGIATNGRAFASTDATEAYVFTETSDSQWNTPCTDTPDSLVGWYKYAPQGGDKGKVEVLFHTNAAEGSLPDNGTTSHHVGSGIIEFTTAKSTWTRFSFPINYSSATLPDYFLIVTTAGDELDAVEGSELWLDDMSFIYNPIAQPTAIEEVEIPYTIFGNKNTLNLSVLKNYTQSSFSLFGLDGKLVWSINSIDPTNVFTPGLNQGIYIYQLTIDNVVYSGKISLN